MSVDMKRLAFSGDTITPSDQKDVIIEAPEQSVELDVTEEGQSSQEGADDVNNSTEGVDTADNTAVDAYSIDEVTGNLLVEKDGKSYTVATKGKFDYNEETGEVSMDEEVDTNLVVFNTDFQEQISPLLDLLPAEERNLESLRFDGSVKSMVGIIQKIGQAQVLATIDELSKDKPEASDLIIHLLSGGTVESFVSNASDAKLDLKTIGDKPNSDQIKSVVFAYLTEVAGMVDPETTYNLLKETDQLNAYYTSARSGLETFYSQREAVNLQKVKDREDAAIRERQAYWSGIKSKVDSLNLGGLTVRSKEEATDFYNFIAIPKGTETLEQKFASTMTDEMKLAEKFVRYHLSKGTIDVKDLNRLFVKATKDSTSRVVKAVITRNKVPMPSGASKVTPDGNTKTGANLTKLSFN